MKIELLKELIGNKIDHCTDDNFQKGYNPIVDIIDEAEGNEIELDDATQNWIVVNNFLDKMSLLSPYDKDYDTIYLISYCNNGFYYSKEADDIFWKEWTSKDGKYLPGNNNLFWYYYFLNRWISKNKNLSNFVLLDSTFGLDEDFGLLNNEEENQSIDPDED